MSPRSCLAVKKIFLTRCTVSYGYDCKYNVWVSLIYVDLIRLMATNNNNNNNRLYYLEFRACKLRVYDLSIIFYVRRYSYALVFSLKCSWALDFDILFVVGLYKSGW